MLWVIFTAFLALVGGLAGWTLGGQPSAAAFTIVGAFVAVGIRDVTHHKHAIASVTILAATLGCYFGGLEIGLVSGLLALPLLIAAVEFGQKQSPFLPLALAPTFLTWWLGWHFTSPMAGLVYALLTFLSLVALHDSFIQHTHAIPHNYPLIGWLRYGFELIGDELRQYWFMSDSEEKPYNRITRRYVYRLAKKLNNSIGFGTQRDYRGVGQIHMLPATFPISEAERGDTLPPLIIGSKRRIPYSCPWPINISGMSFGALSEEAVMALSSGASMANIHIVTGEGGLTPFHTNGVKISPPALDVLRYKLKKIGSFCSFGKIKTGIAPAVKYVGGGRIIIQLGSAKFGFRKSTTRAIAEKLMRSFYTLAGHAPDEPFTMLDLEKLKKVAASDQIVAIELKLAQGAKPGQGGKLPKEKITEEIAKWRGIPMGEDCYSPNTWDEFHDWPTFCRFASFLQKEIGKPVGAKIVVGQENSIVQLAEHIKATGEGPDFITIDGGEGGTGAAPLALADHMGLPILHAIPVVDNILRQFDLRNDITIIASGQIATSADVVIAIAMGADMVNIGRGNLLAEGCIMAMRCHTNQCPAGITTQDPRRRRGLDPRDKYVKVGNYNTGLQHELIMILNSLGKRTPWELTRADLTVITAPMEEKSMAKIHPYPDGSNGLRKPTLGAFDSSASPSNGVKQPKPIRIKVVAIS